MNFMVRYCPAGVALIAATTFLCFPRTLAFALPECVADVHTFHGLRAVTLTVQAVTLEGDSGPVTIDVSIECRSVGTIASSYSQDTLMNVAPATYSWRWLDADVWPDLALSLANGSGDQYFVGSIDGSLHSLDIP